MDSLAFKDLSGNEIRTGDMVVVVPNEGRCLVQAVVQKVTPKGVQVGYPWQGGCTTTFRGRQYVAKALHEVPRK